MCLYTEVEIGLQSMQFSYLLLCACVSAVRRGRLRALTWNRIETSAQSHWCMRFTLWNRVRSHSTTNTSTTMSSSSSLWVTVLFHQQNTLRQDHRGQDDPLTLWCRFTTAGNCHDRCCNVWCHDLKLPRNTNVDTKYYSVCRPVQLYSYISDFAPAQIYHA